MNGEWWKLKKYPGQTAQSSIKEESGKILIHHA